MTALGPLVSNLQVQTIAFLRANTLLTSAIYLECYANPGDGGAGFFTYVPLDTTSADNGGTVIVDAAGQRWHRDTEGGRVSVAWFGADNTGVVDATAAINAALDCLPGAEVFLPPGNFKVSGTITPNAGSSLIGVASKTTITPTAATFTLFQISGSDTKVANLIINNTAKFGGVDFLINTGSVPIQRIVLENIESLFPWGCISDAGTGTTFYITLTVRQVRSRNTRGAVGFQLTRILAFLLMEDCLCDYIGSPSANYPAFVLDNSVIAASGGAVGGAIFRGCNAAGGTAGTGALPNNWGFQISHTAAVWMQDCIADTLDSHGFAFESVSCLNVNNCYASLCNGNGFVFTNVYNSSLTNISVYGRRNAGVPCTANVDGIAFNGNCILMTLSNAAVYGVSGNGIEMGPPGRLIVFNGGRSYNNGKWGIVAAGTGSFFASGMQVSGNVSGSYSLASGPQFLQASQLNSGALANVGPGPVSG